MEKPLWIDPKTHKASMRGITLVGTGHGCKTGVEFLLTQLEVRAPPALRIARH
jgi:hypothetical protein